MTRRELENEIEDDDILDNLADRQVARLIRTVNRNTRPTHITRKLEQEDY